MVAVLAAVLGTTTPLPHDPPATAAPSTAPSEPDRGEPVAEPERLAGPDRDATAAAVARAAFPDGAETVLVARNDDYADALAAASLAGAASAPVLLSHSAAPSRVVRDALDDLGATRVILVGGEQALTQAAAEALAGGARSVERVSGADRVATAAEVARAAAARTGVGELDGARTALLATAAGFADALAAGPVAVGGGLPLLLTDPSGLAAATAAALADLEVEQVVVLGGDAALHPGVEEDLARAGIESVRVAGPTRAHTAQALADLATSRLGFTDDRIVLTTGDGFADALASGPLGGARRAPLVLAAGRSLGATGDWLAERCRPGSRVTAVGGRAPLPDELVEDAAARFTCADADSDDVDEATPADPAQPARPEPDADADGGGREEPAASGAPAGHGAGLTPDRAGVRAAGYVHDAGADTWSHPERGTLRASGSITTTADGQVIEAVDVDGQIVVRHDDVTIRDCRVRYDGTSYAIDAKGASPQRTTIERCTVGHDGSRPHEAIGIYIAEGTVRSTDVSGFQTGIFINGGGTRVLGSRVTDARSVSGTHGTGISANRGASGIEIRGNLIEGNTSASLALYAHGGPYRDVVIADNLFQGGNNASFCLNAGNNKDGAGAGSDIRVTGNHFGRRDFPGCGQFGAYFNWDGSRPGNTWCDNRWADTLAPVGEETGCG